MHVTTVLYGRWPLVRVYNTHHNIFETHEILTDLVVSDMTPLQSLRDTMADGAVASIPMRLGVTVEIIALSHSHSNDFIIDGITDLASKTTKCAELDGVIEAIRQPFDADTDTIRYVIIPEGPFQEMDNDSSNKQKMAANATVVQTLAMTNALDMTHKLQSACPSASLFYALAYRSLRFRGNEWEPSSATVAFAPAGRISLAAATNVHTLPSSILALFPKIDGTSPELQHHEGASITIDSTNEDMWSCTCRVLHEDDRFDIVRYFPPNTIQDLPRYFLRISNPADWHIRDNIGAVDNLAEEPSWCTSATATSLIAACAPVVRDYTRRRSPLVEAFLDAAEEAAAAEPVLPAPDELIPAPEEKAVDVEPPIATQDVLLPWKDSVVARVREMYSESDALTVTQFLQTVDDVTPKTLLLPGDGSFEVLEGAFTPSALTHLLYRARSASLLNASGTPAKLQLSSEKIRIGRIKVDLESFLHCERLVFYKGKGRSKERPSFQKNSVPHHTTRQRGSVQRFVRRLEMTKALMHR